MSINVLSRFVGRPGALAVAAVAVLGLGCRQDMHDQPRYKPLQSSKFFADGMASRQLPEGTIARGHLRSTDPVFFTGKDAAGVVTAELPMPADAVLLRRGHERFDIYCAPCHGRLGDGTGMVARRGFKQPPSFHDDRLVNSPVGYYYDVMTNGFGVMPSYAVAVPPADRWAIAAYIRALQLSQRAHLAQLPAEDQAKVQAAQAAGAEPAAAAGHGEHGAAPSIDEPAQAPADHTTGNSEPTEAVPAPGASPAAPAAAPSAAASPAASPAGH